MINEIILYQPNETIKLEVRLENESVWLTQQQIAELFGVGQAAISKHLRNIYSSGELEEMGTYSILEYMGNEGRQKYSVKYYNLDVILSVGYRVNSRNATFFRRWATTVLRDYLLKGHAVPQRVVDLESRMSNLEQWRNSVEVVLKTSLPPSEGLFFNGQIYDAFACVRGIIKSAKKSILLIDNYIDESVLTMMSDKLPEVEVSIFTERVSPLLELAAEKFNAQYGGLTLHTFKKAHDRFLIIDDRTIFLIGASLKDLGKKLFAFTEIDPSNIERMKLLVES